MFAVLVNIFNITAAKDSFIVVFSVIFLLQKRQKGRVEGWIEVGDEKIGEPMWREPELLY